MNKKTVVAIGNFDGVHRGHQAIIQTAITRAKALHAKSVVYTFRPHPSTVLRPESKLDFLMTYDERAEALLDLGIDDLIEEPFSREFSSIDAVTFFEEILVKKLGAHGIVIGHDFAFGKNREGSYGLLKRMCEASGIELKRLLPLKFRKQVVSSSAIRKLLNDGDVEKANLLLGRPFQYKGIVVRGEGRGKKLGIPTANLAVEEKIWVPKGVYISELEFQGVFYPSVTNIGVRPTFQTPRGRGRQYHGGFSVETHVLDFVGDLYGHSVKLRLFRKLREEKRFSSAEELVKMIRRDIKLTRSYWYKRSKLSSTREGQAL